MHFSVHVVYFNIKFQVIKIKNKVQRRWSNSVHLRLSFLETLALPSIYLVRRPFPAHSAHYFPLPYWEGCCRDKNLLIPSSLFRFWPSHSPAPAMLTGVLWDGPLYMPAVLLLVSPTCTPIRLLLCVFYPLGVLLNVKIKVFCINIFCAVRVIILKWKFDCYTLIKSSQRLSMANKIIWGSLWPNPLSDLPLSHLSRPQILHLFSCPIHSPFILQKSGALYSFSQIHNAVPYTLVFAKALLFT